MRYHIIPKINELDKYLKLSDEFNLGFEYNEFFNPDLLDDEAKLNEYIDIYKSLNRKNDTLHGVFFDIILDSKDKKIRNISIDRIRKSLDIASKLNCRGVIFHTNYNTWLKDDNYKNNWLELNSKIYLELIEEYKDLEIYIENMFDLDPYLLRDLMIKCNHKRIGVCLDIAHASISNTQIDIWFKELNPFIKHIHINDNDLNIDLHEELGKGKIDYKSVYQYINILPASTTILIEISDYQKTYNSILYLKDGGFNDFK